VALLGAKPHVPRPRLVDQLSSDAGLLPRLVLVSVPAGLGKTTTLLSQWLTRYRTAQPPGSSGVAWLSLDADDGNPQRFLTNLVAALHAAEPGGRRRERTPTEQRPRRPGEPDQRLRRVLRTVRAGALDDPGTVTARREESPHLRATPVDG
jgi:ATP/maltotriose-dependent transcriptional regulator MalT